MLNERENFLRALRGEIPEYVPRYSILWTVTPSVFWGDLTPAGGGKDIYGVEWTSHGSAIMAPLPTPGKFLLDDIRKWRDVIRFPDFTGVDWASMAKKDIENHDPNLPRGGQIVLTSFFQALMSFMGFTEGLIACAEEPEEVKALLNCLCDYILGYGEKMLHHYNPDFIMFADDIAAEQSPFVSPATFHDIFAHVWRRYIKFFKDRGCLAVHHNCGKFEAFVDDIVDMGFNGWDPAQVTCNDLASIKSKYGKDFMIITGFDPYTLLPMNKPTEELCRATVKKAMDTFAPGGGFAFHGDIVNAHPFAPEVIEWVCDAYEQLKGAYY